MEILAEKYNFALEWNEGFSMSVEEFPSDFRGPLMPTIAARVAKHFSMVFFLYLHSFC